MARSKPSPHSLSERIPLFSESTVAAPVLIYFVLKSRALEPPTARITRSAFRAVSTASLILLWVVSLLLFSIFVLNIGMVRIRILIKVVL